LGTGKKKIIHFARSGKMPLLFRNSTAVKTRATRARFRCSMAIVWKTNNSPAGGCVARKIQASGKMNDGQAAEFQLLVLL
jgi:hypothetical protein